MNKLLLAVCIGFLASCSTTTDNQGETAVVANDSVQSVAYACPMRCEGDKTYPRAGKCPVCKMDLQEVARADSDSTQHNH